MKNYLISAAISLVLFTSVFGSFIPNDVETGMKDGPLIKCWEPVDKSDLTLGWKISEALYTSCTFVFHPTETDASYVEGSELGFEDEAAISQFIETAKSANHGNTVCFPPEYPFSGPVLQPHAVSRCFCRKELCNLPITPTEFLFHNAQLILVSRDGSVIYRSFVY